MLRKTMKQILTKKIDKWIETVQDPKVIRAIKNDLIITGGCFPSMIENEEPNDYDCYFRTKESVLVVAQYYADVWNEQHPNQKNKLGRPCELMVLDCDNPSQKVLSYYNVKSAKDSPAVLLSNCQAGRVKMLFPSDGVVGDPEEANGSEELGVESVLQTIEEIDEAKADTIIKQSKKEDYDPVFISSNAITLKGGIQIVVRFYGEPDDVHETFDFVHTKAYYDRGEKKLEIPIEVYEAVTNKALTYTGSKYPICSLFRLRKFIARGWTINAGQILKIAMQANQLDLTDINVLEDQLIGVDSLYFAALIKQFRRMERESGFELTSGYVESIIDKVF